MRRLETPLLLSLSLVPPSVLTAARELLSSWLCGPVGLVLGDLNDLY